LVTSVENVNDKALIILRMAWLSRYKDGFSLCLRCEIDFVFVDLIHIRPDKLFLRYTLVPGQGSTGR
jgi:hypothetical protein